MNNIIKRVRYLVPDSLRYSHILRSIMLCYTSMQNNIRSLVNKCDSIDPSYISLTVGRPYQLPINIKTPVIWHSNNQNVSVNKEGVLLAVQDCLGKDSQALVTAVASKGKIVQEFNVTIVNWIANQSKLELIKRLPDYHILAYYKNTIYFCIGRLLFKTQDSFKTRKKITKLPFLPANNFPMLINDYGNFLIGQKKVFWSKDFTHWHKVNEMQMPGNINMFDYYIDKKSNKCYVFAGEYSCEPNDRHKVYRGIVNIDGTQEWKEILNFASITEYKKDNSILTSARHIHIVTVDPYTGYLWIGTGDEDIHSKILFSTDYGESFQILGMGSQEWRTLSIWFTKDYIYWNMDSHEPQKIFRIPRAKIANNEMITPILNSGFTKPGVNYLVIEKSEHQHFPVGVGKVYTETETRRIDNDNQVMALNDKEYDYREIVAELVNGAHFNYCWAKDQNNEKLVIMGAAPEGNLRDMQGRVFGIKENLDSSVQVQELISLRAKNLKADYQINMFTQLVPLFQDNSGAIYFKSRNLSWTGIYKTLLKWKDV